MCTTCVFANSIRIIVSLSFYRWVQASVLGVEPDVYGFVALSDFAYVCQTTEIVHTLGCSRWSG